MNNKIVKKKTIKIKIRIKIKMIRIKTKINKVVAIKMTRMVRGKIRTKMRIRKMLLNNKGLKMKKNYLPLKWLLDNHLNSLNLLLC